MRWMGGRSGGGGTASMQARTVHHAPPPVALSALPDKRSPPSVDLQWHRRSSWGLACAGWHWLGVCKDISVFGRPSARAGTLYLKLAIKPIHPTPAGSDLYSRARRRRNHPHTQAGLLPTCYEPLRSVAWQRSVA